MDILFRRIIRYPIKFYSKVKTDRRLRYSIGTTFLFFGISDYYFRNMYTRKLKGVKKLGQIYRPHESSEEMIVFKNSVIETIFDDKDMPMAILFPKRISSIQKMVQMCNKYGIGVINKDKSETYLENDKYIDKQFLVINQKKMKQLEINENTLTINVGPGWKLSSLNEVLLQQGYYLPVSPLNLNRRIFELFNEDSASIDYLHHRDNFTDFKHLIKDFTVILPNGDITPIKYDKIGQGVNFGSIFLGSQSAYGILGEITLKIKPLQFANDINKQKFYFDENLSQVQLQELILPLQQQLIGKESQKCHFAIKQTNNYTKIEILQKQQQIHKKNIMENYSSSTKDQQTKNQKFLDSQFQTIFNQVFQSKINKPILPLIQQRLKNYQYQQYNEKFMISRMTGISKYSKKIKNQTEKGYILDNKIHLRLNKDKQQQILGNIKEQLDNFKEKLDYFDYKLKFLPLSSDLYIDFMNFKPIVSRDKKQENQINIVNQKHNTEQEQLKQQLYKGIVNEVINNEGEYIQCIDMKIHKKLNQMSNLFQYGANNTEYQLFLKETLDPNRIFLNSQIWHPISRPKFTTLDILFNKKN